MPSSPQSPSSTAHRHLTNRQLARPGFTKANQTTTRLHNAVNTRGAQMAKQLGHGGYGESRNFAGDFTPREAAADVLHLADNLGWARFHLVGHSMSGMLAQRVVLDGQGRVNSAILNTPVAASGLSFSPEGFKLITGSIDSDVLLGQAFAALTGNRLGPGWERFKIRQRRASRNREANHAYLKNCTEQGFLDEIRGNNTPMLVIVGEYDMEPFTEVSARDLPAMVSTRRTRGLSQRGPLSAAGGPGFCGQCNERIPGPTGG